MNKMIVSNLLHRPVRALISVVAIAVEVTLILLMVGLATGLLADSRARQQGIGRSPRSRSETSCCPRSAHCASSPARWR